MGEYELNRSSHPNPLANSTYFMCLCHDEIIFASPNLMNRFDSWSTKHSFKHFDSRFISYSDDYNYKLQKLWIAF